MNVYAAQEMDDDVVAAAAAVAVAEPTKIGRAHV